VCSSRSKHIPGVQRSDAAKCVSRLLSRIVLVQL
jgi:hypothetical protein